MADSAVKSEEGQQEQAPTPKPKRKILRRVVVVFLTLVTITAGYLTLAPSPIDPIAYTPTPPTPLTGPLEPNEQLRSAEILARDQIHGPEDVDLDDAGRIYGATIDGLIARVLEDGTVETFARTGGRPLGIHFDADGNLIVCDAVNGLLSIDADGNITTLASEALGVPFGFTDDVDIASDGTMYFSDASSKFGEGEYILDLFEGRPHGRLLSYDPASRETTVLMDGLHFANGVAVSPDGEFVLVNETYRYRVQRYWLKGEKAGTGEIFIDGLPGFPDGISTSPRGTFWLAMFTVRNQTADFMAPRPWLRNVISKLPSAVWPKPEPYGLVLELDSDGQIIRSLHDPGGEHVSVITSVHEEAGQLYFGTLLNHWIARMPVPEP
jgi:sugar lactone lactonase YvrE